MAKIIIESNGDNSFRYKKDFDTEFEVKAKNFELKKVYKTKPNFWVRASQVFSGEILFQEDIVDVEVDGVVYNNFEDLSEVLTPILFKKGGGSGGGGTFDGVKTQNTSTVTFTGNGTTINPLKAEATGDLPEGTERQVIGFDNEGNAVAVTLGWNQLSDLQSPPSFDNGVYVGTGFQEDGTAEFGFVKLSTDVAEPNTIPMYKPGTVGTGGGTLPVRAGINAGDAVNKAQLDASTATQDNKTRIISVAYTTLQLQLTSTDLEIRTALASHITSLNLTISETEIPVYQITGYPDILTVANGSGGSTPTPEPIIPSVNNFKVIVNSNFADVTSNTLLKQDQETQHEDWAMLLLPPSYTHTGKKTRLIIGCHGTGTVITSTSNTAIGSDFWLSQGYAFLDVNGLPATILNSSSSANNRHYGSPIGIQCYIKAYQYVLQNFNIYPEVFVHGTSMGGLVSFALVQSGAIPVIAQGAFCPCIDLYKQAFFRPWNGAAQRQILSQLWGFTGTAPTFTATVPPTTPEIDYFMSNIDKIVGYENMLKNVFNADRTTIYSQYAEASEDPLYAPLVKYHPVPLKIWHNTNDTTVTIRYSKYYVNMIKKAGGLAELRTFPSGGHNAWLNGEVVTGIPTVTGGTTSIESSVYECYLWFKRFDK